jgi:uncharacterized membrane protein
MKLAHTSDTILDEDEIVVRTIDLSDLRIALAQGWEDFLYKRGDLIFIGLIYPLAVIFVISMISHASILPLIFPLVAGSVMFGPPVASGFYELARRRERRLDTRWRHFFDVLHGPAALPIIGLTSIIFLLFVLWISAAWSIFSATLGTAAANFTGTTSEFFDAVFSTSAGWRMIVVGNLVGLCFAMLVLAIGVVSFPMLVDRPVGIGVAMRTSVRVTRKNPVTVAVWGLIVVGLLVLGSLPALVGLAVVFPVLGYASWHLYTRAVVR